MADKKEGAGHDALIESEKRLGEALKKIITATRGLKNPTGKSEALEAQNIVLENGLKDLTRDYEKLNQAFIEVSEKVKTSQVEPQSNNNELVEENNTLKGELAKTQRDHESLKDSFTLLKKRYAEIEESQDVGGFVIPNEGDGDGNPIADKVAEELLVEGDALKKELDALKEEYSRQIGENELLIAETEAAKLAKKTVADSLDKTIVRLEGMLETTEITH